MNHIPEVYSEPIINLIFINNNSNKRINISCSLDEKISNVINKYKIKSGDNSSSNVFFIFNAKKLNPELSVSQSGLNHMSNIWVINNSSLITGGGNITFEYKIKNNKFIELIPQLTIYFPHIEESKAQQLIEKGEIVSLKKELTKILGDDFDITENNIVLGSILLKVNIFFKKLLSKGRKEKIKEFFIERSNEVKIIKDAVKCIKNKSFQCIENLKPMAVKFINQENLEDKEENEKNI